MNLSIALENYFIVYSSAITFQQRKNHLKQSSYEEVMAGQSLANPSQSMGATYRSQDDVMLTSAG